MRRSPALVCAGLLCLLSACSAGPAAGTQSESARTTVTIFAAASLKDSFGALETDFERDNPQVDIVLDLQGSQDLVSALEEGAQADVVATANRDTMDKLQSGGLVGAVQNFAANTLTIIVPKGNPAGVSGMDASLEGKKLVICAPEVPCGNATKRLAKELGISLNPVSEEQKVTDVRGKVASGEADAGIVYRTDAFAEKNSVEEIAIPGSEKVKNIYPIAVLKNSASHGWAQKWVDYVLSERGQHTLREYGFSPAGEE
ncbi:MAG: molybdate ABC transporter substrate-binding protein [Actinomycetaceae bacterium]|nr:molybdate ABC transporter substrate-binding protein [Actinomycetaceae bacterium]